MQVTRKIKIISFITLSLFLSYYAAWYFSLVYIGQDLVKKVNENKLIVVGHNYIFSSLEPSGFPFKFGYKVHGLEEYSSTGVNKFNEPLYIGYNLPARDIYLNFNGSIISTIYPKEHNKVNLIQAEFGYYVNFLPRLGAISAIKEGNIAKLANYVEDFRFKSGKISVNQHTEKKVSLYAQDYSNLKVEFLNKPKYSTMADLTTLIPSSYSFAIDHKVSFNDYISERLMAESYLLLPLSMPNTKLYSFESEMKAKGKLSLNGFSLDPKLLFKKWNIKIDSYELKIADYVTTKGKVDYKKDSTISKLHEIKASVTGRFSKKFQEDFERQVQAKLMYLTQVLGDNQAARAIIEANKHKYNLVPKLYELGDMKLELDYKGNKSEHGNEIELNNLDFDSALYKIQASNKTFIDTALHNWYSKGRVGIFHYKRLFKDLLEQVRKIVKFATFSQVDSRMIGLLEGEFEDEVLFLAKKISNHPETTSEDLFYDINIGSDVKDPKIGSVSPSQLMIMAQEIILEKAFKEIVKDKLDKELKKVAPNLPDEATKELKKILPEKVLPGVKGKDARQQIEGLFKQLGK